MRLDEACEARALGQLTPAIAVNFSSCNDHVVARSLVSKEGVGGTGLLDEMICYGF